MTKEELFDVWGILANDYNEYHPEYRERIRQDFFKALYKWFDAELKRNTKEMQKCLIDKAVRKQFIRLLWKLIKGESFESLEKEFGGEND